ncbi:MAG: DNA-directed DNA polymerase [Candidatus Asgardarchaeia archaeon]
MSEKIIVWPLDTGYRIVNSKVYVELWCLDENGRRVLLIDDTFKPYFYLKLKNYEKKEEITRKLKSLKGISSCDEVEKKYLGKTVRLIKVTYQNPQQLNELKRVKRWPTVEEIYEADIRYYLKYMMERGIYPCRWYEFEVEKVDGEPWNEFHVDSTYKVVGKVRELDMEEIPELRMMAFDIECYNPKGTPDVKKDPIIIISVACSNGTRKQFIKGDDEGDSRIIEEFSKFIKLYDPDIIFGYNTNRFDWIYLNERAKINSIKLIVGRDGSTSHPGIYGHQSVSGRANIDLMDYAESLYEVKVKTLKNVAEYLGILKKEERVIIPHTKIFEFWDDPNKRPDLFRYAMEDAESTLEIGIVAVPLAIELSRIVGLPLDQILAASVGFRVEWYLMREAHKIGELIPNRGKIEHMTYRGGLVFSPEKGLHKNVAYMDFASLYPSLIIRYNIGPDTYVPPFVELKGEDVYTAPEVGHRFLKDPPSIFKRAIEVLIEERKKVRATMKGIPEDSTTYKVLNNRQKALKIIANACYGYTGWVGARWYSKPVAEAITAWGRKTIMDAKSIAEEMGLKVYYGDTDSLFLEYDERKIRSFVEEIRRRLDLEIKPDRIYKVILFTEAKKRYAGIDMNGNLDITGFEVVRGDWAGIARDLQEKVLLYVLRDESLEKALDYVHKVIRDLRDGKVPFEKLIIWKTVTKSLEEYKVHAAHIRAAKILEENGIEVSPGTQIGFVILKGSGKLYEKAYPYQFAKYEDLDIDYYIEKQIIPVALRILENFGVKEKDLKSIRKQSSLFDFT